MDVADNCRQVSGDHSIVADVGRDDLGGKLDQVSSIRFVHTFSPVEAPKIIASALR
jgi:hypothetical protein